MTEQTTEPQRIPAALCMNPISLPQLLAASAAFASAPRQRLEQVLSARAAELGGDSEAQKRAVREVGHHGVMIDWCRENAEAAATLVLCAVYLSQGRFVVQEAVPVEGEPASGPHEGAATDEPREAVEAPADGTPVTIGDDQEDGS